MTKARKHPSKPLNKRLMFILIAIVVIMFFFGFALVPIYSVLCKTTGLNGKTDTSAVEEYMYTTVDKKRSITVEFLGSINEQLPVSFTPSKTKLTMHPGEIINLHFTAKNLSDKPIAVQAVPSVSPGLAAKYIKKIECFCFTRQELAPYEEKIMPLKIFVHPALSTDVTTLTLSYTLFEELDNKNSSLIPKFNTADFG